MDKPEFFTGPGGTLLCDERIEGVTQELCGSSVTFYGAKYLIAETMTWPAADTLVKALGGVWREPVGRKA